MIIQHVILVCDTATRQHTIVRRWTPRPSVPLSRDPFLAPPPLSRSRGHPQPAHVAMRCFSFEARAVLGSHSHLIPWWALDENARAERRLDADLLLSGKLQGAYVLST